LEGEDAPPGKRHPVPMTAIGSFWFDITARR
jgi:hypothetical protein